MACNFFIRQQHILPRLFIRPCEKRVDIMAKLSRRFRLQFYFGVICSIARFDFCDVNCVIGLYDKVRLIPLIATVEPQMMLQTQVLTGSETAENTQAFSLNLTEPEPPQRDKILPLMADIVTRAEHTATQWLNTLLGGLSHE